MKRTTVVLPDDLAALLEFERRRRGVSAAEIIREALTAYLVHRWTEKRELPFVGLGRSGYSHTSEEVEELLRQEWGGNDLASSCSR